jgi:hypothetical protein
VAKDIAEDLDLQRTVPAGIVSQGNILYKGNGLSSIDWNFEDLPTKFALYTNYPNPFNPNTTIQYDIPKASQVTLVIYNVLGQKVRELIKSYQEAGRYSVNFDAGNLPSGLYIYRLQAGYFTSIKKMILLK